MSLSQFFQWADQQGYSIRDLARLLGYEYTTVYYHSKGKFKNTRSFEARAVRAFGPEVARFFDSGVSSDSDSDTVADGR